MQFRTSCSFFDLMSGLSRSTMTMLTWIALFSHLIIHSSTSVVNEQNIDGQSNAQNKLDLIDQHHKPTTSRPWSNDSGEIIISDCDAFYFVYMEYAGKFMHCELANAVPFRMCVQCIAEYTIAHSTFEDLKKNPSLHDCRKKYLSADSIQILPTVQRNIEAIWSKADCSGCTVNVSLDSTTKEVSYEIPADILYFMHLFENMTGCVNETTKDWTITNWLLGQSENVSVCTTCLPEYTAVNKQYTTISNRLGGAMCMDLIDMMNYTRHNWSSTFHCSHRSGIGTPTVITTTFLSTTPFLFYVMGRVTKKRRQPKYAKQKRLTASQDHGALSDATNSNAGVNESYSSYSYAGPDGQSANLNTRMRRVL